MAKPDNSPIGKQDIIAYLDSESDFSFELEVLNTALGSGYQFSHGGTYEDPVTGVSREYDIRGIAIRNKCEIRFAIECKNLRENFPLAVLRVPRNSNESYHYLWSKGDESSIESLRCKPSRYYESIKKVGKSCGQVSKSNGKIDGNDSEVYKKWTQAVSSAHGLLANFRYSSTYGNHLMVLPFLVVPDERLWIADYDQTGKRLGDPVRANYCSYFLGKSYSFNPELTGKIEYSHYTISHLEIMTKTGLYDFLHELKTNEEAWKVFFYEQ